MIGLEPSGNFLRFDELIFIRRIAAMDDRLVFEMQRLYPQIYLACHIDHVRASSTSWRLSSHDSSVVAHLSRSEGTSPGDLASHLEVVPSTLSATIKRLERLGYVTNTHGKQDKRRREIR